MELSPFTSGEVKEKKKKIENKDMEKKTGGEKYKRKRKRKKFSSFNLLVRSSHDCLIYIIFPCPLHISTHGTASKTGA